MLGVVTSLNLYPYGLTNRTIQNQEHRQILKRRHFIQRSPLNTRVQPWKRDVDVEIRNIRTKVTQGTAGQNRKQSFKIQLTTRNRYKY